MDPLLFHFRHPNSFPFRPLPPPPPPPLPPPPPPPPPPAPSTGSNFPILAISILGILSTSILALSYYIFGARWCRLNRHRRSDAVSRLSLPHHHRHGDDHPVTYDGAAANESHGLCESEIQALPTFAYRSGSAGRASYFRECAVCLGEFQEEERLRLLPNCLHVFHIQCIDTWLRANPNCPLCRAAAAAASPVPLDRLMTPIGDVVIDVRDAPAEAVGRGKGTEGAHSGSMGDECVDTRQACVPQPMRRSFSVDSLMDRRLHAAVQKIVRQNPHFPELAIGEGSSGGGRIRRSFFSFHRHSRGCSTFA